MKLSKSLQVIIDCSTFLSGAFYQKGKPRKILKLWQNEEFEVIISKEILKEYKKKLKPVAKRMKKDTLAAEFYLDLIETESITVIPEKIDPKTCRDPNDLKYLDVAKACQADFLISSDKDLLVLRKFEKTEIVTPNEFLKNQELSEY